MQKRYIILRSLLIVATPYKEKGMMQEDGALQCVAAFYATCALTSRGEKSEFFLKLSVILSETSSYLVENP